MDLSMTSFVFLDLMAILLLLQEILVHAAENYPVMRGNVSEFQPKFADQYNRETMRDTARSFMQLAISSRKIKFTVNVATTSNVRQVSSTDTADSFQLRLEDNKNGVYTCYMVMEHTAASQNRTRYVLRSFSCYHSDYRQF